MESGIDFDDEENDFNAINSSVTKRKLRIESDSENEDVCDASSNIKSNKLIESEHTKKITEDVAGLDKEHIIITEHAMEGVEENADLSDKENEYVVTKETPGSEVNGHNSVDRLATVNSDSEDESYVSSNDKNTTKSVSKGLAIVDSDSEGNEDHSETTKNVSKRLAVVDSDSDDDLKSSSSNVDKDEFSNDGCATVDECNKDGKSISENNPDELTTSTFQKSRLSALYDSESSEDESRVLHDKINSPDFSNGAQVSKSKKPKVPAKPKEHKMTAKQALEQRQEIASESQRMMRESRVSLPYHVPKQRSIKEFLQNRPKFASSLLQSTCRTPPSLAMKMSVQQLEVVVKNLEERSKEIQKFYESESESEEETLNEPAEDDENVNKDNDNLTTLDDGNNQSEENAMEVSGDLELSSGVNNETEGNENAIIESREIVNNENEKATDIEETYSGDLQEIVTNQTEEMVSLVMFDTNQEAETSNPTGLEASTETIKDIQNKTELEHDSIQNSDDKNNSNPILDTSTEIPETEEMVQKKLLEDSGNSMTYEFNLDDLEESEGMVEPQLRKELQEPDILVEIKKKTAEEQKTIEEEYFQKILQKYEGDSTQSVENELSTLELLKQKLGDTVPFLKAVPGEEIDLDDTGNIDGITQLKERFIKHAVKKSLTKHKVQLDVINLSQGEIHKETVRMSVVAEEEPIVVNEKPGLKLRKLKNELEMQMAQRRSELWKQRQSDFEKVESEEKAEYETEAILDDEDEAEMTEEDTTDGEMENEEMLMDVDEESKDKCTLLDDQAEDDDEDEENMELNEIDENDEDELNEDQEGDGSEVKENEKSEECDVTTTRKPRRTLIRGPLEAHSDSDDEEAEPLFKMNVNGSLSSTDTAEVDEFPPNLPLQNINEKTPSKSKSQFSFLTPIQQLTGLQSLNSGSKFLNGTSPTLHSNVLPEPLHLKENSFSAEDAEDTEDTANSQASLVEENLEKPNAQKDSPIENTIPTTQDFLNICSGNFSIDCETQNNESLKSQLCDNDTHIFIQPVEPTQINLNISEEVKNLDEDNLITQLLDEDELEQFRRKFDSPLVPKNTESETITKSGRLIIDSSDDENEDNVNPRKKTKKKLDFSDDESNVESEENREEEIDLHENISEDELEDEESSNVVMEYDSEENEIEVDTQEKKKSKSSIKSREFFENEAELSESEWGSEDEDEKGLDILETEQGDADVFDEDKMRNDLEKIHMRRVLDQDNQEIKMLQELLLEDGELHGTGRQKQFRWRNIDDMDNEEVKNDVDVDVYLDEEESEEQWRKIRHEREMFLKNRSDCSIQNDNLTASENDSQILKLGEEALRKGNSKVALEKSKLISNTIEVTKPFGILNTRGSFLARSDKFLNKLAEINKVNTSIPTKNIKKIVFETKSIESDDTAGLLNGKKRKASEGTPASIKKLRLSSNLSPNVKNLDRKKKLFK